jgi:protein SCO1/2
MPDLNKNYTAGFLSLLLIFIFSSAALLYFINPFNQPAQPASNNSFQGGGFTLQSSRGPVSLSDYHGKLVILYFGYTYCPDICPTSLGLLSLALNELTPDELNNIQSLFISVDPERDTVERLETYASAFNAGIRGITGSPVEIADIANRYGAYYKKAELPGSAMGYSVDHTSQYYLVDRDGKLIQQINHGTEPLHIVSILRYALTIN